MKVKIAEGDITVSIKNDPLYPVSIKVEGISQLPLTVKEAQFVARALEQVLSSLSLESNPPSDSL